MQITLRVRVSNLRCACVHYQTPMHHPVYDFVRKFREIACKLGTKFCVIYLYLKVKILVISQCLLVHHCKPDSNNNTKFETRKPTLLELYGKCNNISFICIW